jgi:hypothetical protein
MDHGGFSTPFKFQGSIPTILEELTIISRIEASEPDGFYPSRRHHGWSIRASELDTVFAGSLQYPNLRKVDIIAEHSDKEQDIPEKQDNG